MRQIQCRWVKLLWSDLFWDSYHPTMTYFGSTYGDSTKIIADSADSNYLVKQFGQNRALKPWCHYHRRPWNWPRSGDEHSAEAITTWNCWALRPRSSDLSGSLHLKDSVLSNLFFRLFQVTSSSRNFWRQRLVESNFELYEDSGVTQFRRYL